MRLAAGQTLPVASSSLLFANKKTSVIVPSPLWTLSASSNVFLSASIRGGPTQSYQLLQWRLQSHPKREEHDNGEEEERPVHYEVDVVSWRERRIRVKVLLHADVDTVWRVLTSYERLANFIPNLIYSGRIPAHISVGYGWSREACKGLCTGTSRLEWSWIFRSSQNWSSTSILTYEVSVIPRFYFPAIFLERIIRPDLPVNLRALACRAEKCIEDSQMSPLPAKPAGSNLPSTFPSRSMSFLGDLYETDHQNLEMLKGSYAGHAFVSAAPSSNNEFKSKCGVFGKVCRFDRSCVADEVHLRRFDGLLENGGSHRCVVGSITVKAPVHEVWNVLTAYETLPEKRRLLFQISVAGSIEFPNLLYCSE